MIDEHLAQLIRQIQHWVYLSQPYVRAQLKVAKEQASGTKFMIYEIIFQHYIQMSSPEHDSTTK